MGMITTTHGIMSESRLRKVEGSVDNDNESTTWVEYYLGDELVHRSAHVTLKGVLVNAIAGALTHG
jgi:hypothetical protein